jgi:hypothetical protein
VLKMGDMGKFMLCASWENGLGDAEGDGLEGDAGILKRGLKVGRGSMGLKWSSVDTCIASALPPEGGKASLDGSMDEKGCQKK